MTDTPNKPTLKAERLASGGSVVSMPDFNYCDHFDVEADKAAFNAKWKNSSTPEEIEAERVSVLKSRIRTYRKEGLEWMEIGKRVGRDRETCRALVDETFAAKLKARKSANHKRYAEERKAA